MDTLTMTKKDVLKHFGGVTRTAEALGCSHVAVSRWKESPPKGRQYEIQVLTGGVLKAAA